MNTRSLRLTIGAGVLGLASGITVALSGGAGAAAPATLHVQELAKNVTYVPTGTLTGSKAQSNRGDYVTFSDPLVKPGTTNQVGRVDGSCWLTAPNRGLFYCSVNFSIFGQGQIAGSGLFDSSGKATTAEITGGTGTYRSARGVVVLKALSQTKNDFAFTFDR